MSARGAPRVRGPRRPIRFGLRWTLLVALLPLLTLPWIGLRFVERMAELARDERLDGLAATASTLAAALHERRDLFDPALTAERLPAGADPWPLELVAAVSLDGRADEWIDVPRRRLRVTPEGEGGARTLGVRIALVRSQEQPGGLYLLVDADDERFVRPGSDTDPEAAGDRVIVEGGDTPATMQPLPLVSARGGPVERDGGWLAEYRIDGRPRLLHVKVVDVDYLGSRKVEAVADSGLLAPLGGPRAALDSDAVRAERWNDTLRALGRVGGRVSVFDAAGDVLVQRGEVAVRVPVPGDWTARIARWLMVAAVPFDRDDASVADGAVSPMSRALLGVAGQSAQRIGEPGSLPVWLLTSAQPIWLEDRVVGALVLEESTASRVAIGQRALERLVLLAVAAVAASAGALMLMASITVSRIVRLRNASERAIDARGRVVREVVRDGLPGAGPIRDELGDLAASHARVLARLAEYQDYLGKLRSRLVHELRTPIMVVRSSIENLLDERDEARRAEYLQRTQQGAARLERIVASMSEAASLESLLADSELERVDLAALVASCVQGYRGAFAPRAFDARIESQPAIAMAAPEALVQALDKLVSNAVDFARPGTPITVSLSAVGAPADEAPAAAPAWRIAVRNEGPPLPSSMAAGSLFDSMVSVRSDSAADTAHLGLGLYLVRLIAEFHGGDVDARDVEGGVEVAFTIAAR